MIDRASTFADRDIIRMLQEDFVPVAFDQWFHRRQQDKEGQYYRRIAMQGPRNDLSKTTQGFYVVGADGELVAYNNNRGADRIRELMKSAIAKDHDWHSKPIADNEPDRDFSYTIPDGSVVVQVNSRVLSGYKKPRSEDKRHLQNAIGRDNMWVSPGEKAKLLDGQFPDSLAERIARFHLIDNTRGEPPMWTGDELKSVQFTLDSDGTVRGRVQLQTAEGAKKPRSYDADLFGHIETSDGEITRFDIVAKGLFEGEGNWTWGAPGGQFPVAIALRLADENDIAFSVWPQALKAVGSEYLTLGQ